MPALTSSETFNNGLLEDNSFSVPQDSELKIRQLHIRSGQNLVTWTVANNHDKTTLADIISVPKIDISGKNANHIHMLTFFKKYLGLAFTPVCTPCPAGTYSLKGSQRCELCASNTFSQKGSPTCERCLQSEYSGFNLFWRNVINV